MNPMHTDINAVLLPSTSGFVAIAQYNGALKWSGPVTRATRPWIGIAVTVRMG